MIDFGMADKPLKTIKTHEMTLPFLYNSIIDVHQNNIETDIHRFDIFSQTYEYEFLSLKFKEKITSYFKTSFLNVRFDLA